MQGLSKSFGHRRVLDDVHLSVRSGEILVIMGPSGSGKSTLLRCINFLERPDAGQVWVGGEPMGFHLRGTESRADSKGELRRKRARIGMVFQRFNLFANLTVLDNVTFGPRKVLGISRDQAEGHARALLARVQMSQHERKHPAQLSGGEQQRVAIARALAMNPVLLLLDEPTSSLDPELVGEVLDVMEEIARDGMTMLVVTHEVAFARDVAKRVIFMEDGRFVEENPPDIMFTRPTEERTIKFLARILRQGESHATR